MSSGSSRREYSKVDAKKRQDYLNGEIDSNLEMLNKLLGCLGLNISISELIIHSEMFSRELTMCAQDVDEYLFGSHIVFTEMRIQIASKLRLFNRVDRLMPYLHSLRTRQTSHKYVRDIASRAHALRCMYLFNEMLRQLIQELKALLHLLALAEELRSKKR